MTTQQEPFTRSSSDKQLNKNAFNNQKRSHKYQYNSVDSRAVSADYARKATTQFSYNNRHTTNDYSSKSTNKYKTNENKANNDNDDDMGNNSHERPHSNAYPLRYTFCGFLDVRMNVNKPWKRRYFVLNNNFLLAGATNHSKKIESILPLEGSTLKRLNGKKGNSNGNTANANMEFQLLIRRRSFHFRAPSPKLFQSWTKHLSKASILKIKDVYRFLFTLGTSESQNTKVVAAKHRTTGEDCAIKIVDKKLCDPKMLNTEIKILKKLENPNIVSLYDIFETKKYLYMVMEKCEGGELFDQIAKLDGDGFGEQDCVTIMHQIVSGLKYMHDMGIVHRDLKPENILCVKPDSIKKVKIADFGISKILTNNGNNPNGHLMKTLCGTLTYTAPEILRGKGYDQSVDYWSIGVIMYILLCGYPPFWGETEHEITHSVLKDDVEFDDDDWKHVSNTTKELVEGLLNRNPRQRKSIDDILKVTWKIISQRSVNDLQNKKAFPRTTKLKFKQTVIKRKIFRKSMIDFEKSSENMNRIGYNNNLNKINGNNSNKKPFNLKKQSSTDDMVVNTSTSKSNQFLNAPNNDDNIRSQKNGIKINAFQGRRGSKGLEMLELQLPMTQRPSFVGQMNNNNEILPTISEATTDDTKTDE